MKIILIRDLISDAVTGFPILKVGWILLKVGWVILKVGWDILKVGWDTLKVGWTKLICLLRQDSITLNCVS